MIVRKGVFIATLFLWSGLVSFILAGTADAAYYDGWQEERFPIVLSSAQISQLAEQKIEEKLAALGETRRHEVRLQRAPNTMRLPAGEVTAEVEFPQELIYGRQIPIGIAVYVDGVLYRRVTSYYRIMVYDRVLVSIADISPESTLSSANVRLEERAVETAPAATLTDFSVLEGRVAARVIRRGTIIMPNMLTSPLVLRVGSPVHIVVHSGGISLRAEGIAMEQGRIGRLIRVRNVRSGKVLRGRVIDEETVEVSG